MDPIRPDVPTPASSLRTQLSDIDWGAGGIESELGWSVNAMFQGFVRAASIAVKSVPGGPRGYQVLIAVTTEEPTSQLVLAHRLGIDKTAMTYVIDALEGEGLVQRRPDPRDRRIRQVFPTREGVTVLDSARIALRAVESALMHDLSAAEQIQLRHLLARVALSAGDNDSGEPAPAEAFEQPIAAPALSRRATRLTGAASAVHTASPTRDQSTSS